MRSMRKLILATAAAAWLVAGAAGADDATSTVKIKAWKADPVELLDQPDGKVVTTKRAAELPTEAVRTGKGWLKVTIGGKDYYVEASQARTDLKLSGKPKCDTLVGATGHAASRGLGDQGCEP